MVRLGARVGNIILSARNVPNITQPMKNRAGRVNLLFYLERYLEVREG